MVKMNWNILTLERMNTLSGKRGDKVGRDWRWRRWKQREGEIDCRGDAKGEEGRLQRYQLNHGR